MFIVTDYLKNIYKSFIVSELTLNDYISAKEVLKTINKLSNKKTTESNKILNKILKIIVSAINADLI